MTQPNDLDPDHARLEALAARAAWALRVEALWPLATAFFMFAALFLTLSWLGLWQELPRAGRIAGVAAFALALGYVAWRALILRPPARMERLARLDRDSGLKHRPASALADTLANPASDPATNALWALHRSRLAHAARALRVAAPDPQMPRKDRFALRAAALVALAAAAFVAGPERGARLMSAFDWRADPAAGNAQAFRVDAWIDPPGYTGRAPVLLDLRKPQAGAQAAAPKVSAPINSTLIVRASGAGDFSIEASAAIQPAGDAKPADGESRFTLRGDGHVALRRDGAAMTSFDIAAIPDAPPTIEFTEDPAGNLRGSLTLSYKIADDYGVVGAEAIFSQPKLRGQPLTGRSLVEPPRLGLLLPAAAGGLGAGQTIGDLSEHPWAGATVSVTLTARDEGGNVGKSETREMTLPQRPFVKPLARALVEQRRNLALAPDDSARVGVALDALMIAPEKFDLPAAQFLGLSAAASRLRRARSDADLLSVADLLWEMALRIEDGDLSQAERDLRAAQNALREALARGASDEEIKKLMGDVRAALDKFMQELAQQAQRDTGDQAQRQDNQRSSRMLTPKDLKSMMDRIEEMAKSGNLAEAQRMLDQMQKMLENLRTAKRRQGDPQRQQMGKALNELDALTKEEQNLCDDTFKQEQRNKRRQQNAQRGQRNAAPKQKGQRGAPQSPQDGMTDDEAEDDSADAGDAQSAEEAQQGLADRQQALRERLEQLQKRMKQFGQSGDDGLGEADDAMKEAEGKLGQGMAGSGASDAQGRALDSMRKGAQKMQQAMRDRQQGGPGEPGDQADDSDGDGDPEGFGQQGGGQGPRDPLGRQNDPKGLNSNARGLNEGAPAARRAQQVLDELRRRLGETARPQAELDYLERLLKRY